MRLTGWRIVQSCRVRTAFDGEGARLYGGRWNHRGVSVIYTASSQSLAALEMLIHLPSPEILQRYVTIPIMFDDSLCTRLDPKDLPRQWRNNPALLATKDIGTNWINDSTSAVLVVPSAVVPDEGNFLINPRHPDFGKVLIGTPQPFKFDARLLKA